MLVSTSANNNAQKYVVRAGNSHDCVLTLFLTTAIMILFIVALRNPVMHSELYWREPLHPARILMFLQSSHLISINVLYTNSLMYYLCNNPLQVRIPLNNIAASSPLQTVKDANFLEC